LSKCFKTRARVIKKYKALHHKEDPVNKIWLYWENKDGNKKPVYISLCHKSVIRHCSKDFEIVILSPSNLYLVFPLMRRDLDHLSIPQKADYIRLYALSREGGIWLDSDIIVFKSLNTILQKLQIYDYVGFGCHHQNCDSNTSGYGKPANWVMVSRKNGQLVTKCLSSADRILDSQLDLSNPKNYHRLGRELIWKEIQWLRILSPSWKYYHYDSSCIERDSHGKKYTNNRFTSNEEIDLTCDFYFIPLYNTAPGFPNWFLNMDEKNLLRSDLLVSKFFRKALL
tara:strand:- start:2059 stop:2907 length:849 start_codon:yes stop_codon:yes gene_type:complete